ncbi:hypothetical protein B0H16DRAFT_1423196 [Mycena metata]|uniref:P-loop containing nucleoside triphosphate hydrolase protein n=2 Tax=Mycena metata TaxID=1033252 RepID=A0AAD7IJ30_9AGAR|nr:hypothetical protein B0H16DRAFT_1423196 [Mycena metata]
MCGNSGPFNFEDACVRSSWSAVLALLVVLPLSIAYLPVQPPGALKKFKAAFTTYLTLDEAEALNFPPQELSVEEPQIAALRWRTLVFTFTGLLQTIGWIASAVLYFLSADQVNAWTLTQPLLAAFSWLYTAVRAVASPPITAPYDLFSVYVLQVAGGILILGGHLFDSAVGVGTLPPTPVLMALSVNILVVFVLLYVTVQMPINLPSRRVKKEDIGHSVSPEDYTKLLGWLTFSWVYPLVKLGKVKTLNDNDIWRLSPTMQSRAVFLKFRGTMRSATLLRHLVASNSFDMILDFIGTILFTFLGFSGPFFLKRLLDCIDQPDPTSRDTGLAYVYAGLMFLAALIKTAYNVQRGWSHRRMAARVRAELMAAIYDKTLRRRDFSGVVKSKEGNLDDTATNEVKVKIQAEADHSSAGAAPDTAKIINLMSTDAETLSYIASTMYFLYAAPFNILIGSIFLYQILGWSAFAGFGVLLVGWPLNSYMTSWSFSMSKGHSKARDKRTTIVAELISSIKFVKFFAWENRWIERAMAAREEEMKWMAKSVRKLTSLRVWSVAPISLAVIAFFTFVWLGNELTVGIAFTVRLCDFILSRVSRSALPRHIVAIIDASVALNRVAVYLAEDEVGTQAVSSLKHDSSRPSVDGVDEGLGFENASFCWNQAVTPSTSSNPPNASSVLHTDDDAENHRFELKDLSVLFPQGKLSVITGPTASGKTALLLALMGEMTLLPGGRIIMSKNNTVDEHGNMQGIAYAAQSPWLRHQSIKDNILFGSPLDQERYDTVVECCALEPDFGMLEDGDATEIGENGISLSGGQKARVALARAVYARKQYVLLDDPLSAVDSHTSQLLFEKCLCGPLLAHRTVILVTHHVELVLPGAHYVVRVLDGRIDAQGTVEELHARGLLDVITHEAENKEIPTVDATGDIPTVHFPLIAQASVRKPRKLVEDERREIGNVKLSVYQTYLSASGYHIWGILLLLVVVQQLRAVGEKLWIKVWAGAYQTPLLLRLLASSHFYPTDAQISLLPNASSRPFFYIGVYTAIAIFGIVLQLSSLALQYTGALRASRILFRRLLASVAGLFLFFTYNSAQFNTGRILSRFGSDFNTIDMRIAGSLQEFNTYLGGFFVSILTVIVVFPPFLVPASITSLLYRFLAIGYVNTGRDLRRMESNNRSPIYSNFGEVLAGIVTVRAFSAEKRFLYNFFNSVDVMNQMWYSFWMLNRWLQLNFDVLFLQSVFITALLSIATLHNDAGLAGLAITSALTFSDKLYWACRSWTDLELDLNSVERIVEYTELPQEPPGIIESHRPPAYWPSSAENSSLVVVQDLHLRYAPELPAVLHGVSFELKAGERVGLVGRTGSGKSSLVMSLLRFVCIQISGRIVIDGIDISKIGIYGKSCCAALTFIPQDATLFSGTLRENLDPFSEHEDSVCLDVLRRVHLLEEENSSHTPPPFGSRPGSIVQADISDSSSTDLTTVDAKPSLSLETQVSAGGNNFSQGQRQLIALARALLRRSSIVVMDEATSSVDFETDAKIQKTIREEFTGSLLITVAHRLRTIIDYDRLLVLDKGRIAGFDTPLALMQKEDGIFRDMCMKSGVFEELEAAAMDHSTA